MLTRSVLSALEREFIRNGEVLLPITVDHGHQMLTPAGEWDVTSGPSIRSSHGKDVDSVRQRTRSEP